MVINFIRIHSSNINLVELTSVRSRLSQLEASKAEVDLGLKKSEENLQTEIENFEKASKKSEERQRQGFYHEKYRPI